MLHEIGCPKEADDRNETCDCARLRVAYDSQFPNPKMVPGVPRTDEEGNNKIYEHEVVTDYWLKNYVGPDSLCVLCKNSGRIKLEGQTVFCICPNGQAIRWYSNPANWQTEC